MLSSEQEVARNVAFLVPLVTNESLIGKEKRRILKRVVHHNNLRLFAPEIENYALESQISTHECLGP